MNNHISIVDGRKNSKEDKLIVPFFVLDEHNNLHVVIEDECDKIRVIALPEGFLFTNEFESVEEYFKEYPEDKVVNVEIRVL